MKDELEDFVKKNRLAFDDKEPSPQAWQPIEKALFRTRTVSLWNSVNVWRAAAVIFMALSIYLLVPKSSSRQAEVSMKEFSDVEAYYFDQISMKTEMIHEYQKQEGLNGFTHDFQQLEAMYQVLKEEMKSKPSKKVKDALVLNLLVRIDLLNQQLHKLEREGVEQEDGSQDEKEEGKAKTNA